MAVNNPDIRSMLCARISLTSKRLSRCLLLLLACCFNPNAYGQNLVPNGDFESYNACPSGLSQIVYSVGYASFPTAQNWVSPLVTTPDYLNTCASSLMVSVPGNFVGYQQPHSGNAYVGLFIEYYASTSGNVWREYITTKLTKSMKKDSAYCVRFFVSPTKASIVYPVANYVDDIAINDMGANFSDTMPHISNSLGLNLPYHVINDTARHLSDTSRWYEIQGIYFAKGGEEWMTIGSFARTLLPAYSRLSANNKADLSGYTYLDDVSVIPAAQHDSMHYTAFCDPGITLTASAAAGPYRWSTGDTARTIYITQSGDYTCRTSKSCEILRDVFHVAIDAYDSAYNITICDTGKIDLQLTSRVPAGPYRWNTGETARTIRINRLGDYVCIVRNGCKIFTDSFRITAGVPPPPPVVHDTTICQYAFAPQLTVYDTGLLWFKNAQGGSGSRTQPLINTAEPGNTTIYVARQTGTCISSRVPLIVMIADRPDIHDPKTLTRCTDGPGGQLTIGTASQPAMMYAWSTGGSECCITPVSDGRYIRTASNQCGVASDTFYVRSEPCEHCVAFPDAFTPNGDGVNDGFRALARCSVKDFHMQIRNRWGQAIYTSDHPDDHWDGRHKGVPAPAGTYMYFASYTSVLTGMKAIVEGEVTLIR